MTLQRCRNCGRLTVATLCSMCHAGAAGANVDQEFLYVLQHEETRLGMQAMLGPVRERVDTINAQRMQNMTPKERAAMWGSATRADERPWIASEDELVERVEKRRDTMRRLFPPRPSLLARFRRWFQGAP